MLPTIFKKIRLSTFENIGSGPIYLPEEELHTSATWLELTELDEQLTEKTVRAIITGRCQYYAAYCPYSRNV